MFLCMFPKHQPNNVYDYKDHYQQRLKQKQDIQQYGYPLPSSSTSQLTLPLTRSLYHSSLVSHLQTSIVHTNSICQSQSYRSSNEANTISNDTSNGHINDTLSLSMLRGNRIDLDLTYEHQTHGRQSSGRNERRNERKKYRKHDRKTKHRRSSSRETSFGRIQELGIPESYKISYPHYYEDDGITSNNTPHYASSNGDHSSVLNNTMSIEKKRVYSEPFHEPGRTSPIVGQYAELDFRDVGQEIDV